MVAVVCKVNPYFMIQSTLQTHLLLFAQDVKYESMQTIVSTSATSLLLIANG